MRSYTFECESCGYFDIEVAHGEGAPEAPACLSCEGPTSRVYGMFQSVVKSEPDFTKSGAIPMYGKLSDPYGRSSKKFERDHEKFVAAKKKFAKRIKRERGTTRNENSMRHVGSIPMHELLAYQRATGRKNILGEEGPIQTLKKLNRHFDQD